MDWPNLSAAPVMMKTGETLVIGHGVAAVLNPSAGRFVTTGSPLSVEGQPFQPRAAVTLLDGRVLALGDFSAQLYSPGTGIFVADKSGLEAHDFYQAVVLLDRRVLLPGEYLPSQRAASPSAFIFDPVADKLIRTGSMSIGRSDAPAIQIRPYDRLVEAYSPVTGKFTRAGELQDSYHTPVAGVLLSGGRILVVGNLMTGPVAELFDPATGISRPISAALPSGPPNGQIGIRHVVLLDDAKALLHIFDFQSHLNYLLTFDAAKATFTEAGSFQTPGGWLPRTVLNLGNGKVLFCGGVLTDTSDGVPADLAGLYERNTGFVLLGSRMIQARDRDTGVSLRDGRVLIAGGLDASGVFSSAELFQP